MRLPHFPLLAALLACLALSVAQAQAPAASSAAAEPAGDRLRVVYVGNAGFLIEHGDKKVLIDVLFRAGVPGYPVHDAALRNRIENGREPFDGVDLLLTTHLHNDHFDPNAVGKYLAANKSTQLLAPTQTGDRLMRNFVAFDAIKDRVHVSYPREGDKKKFSFDGIDVTVMTMHHGRSVPFQQTGFLVELDGFKVLHMGDTSITYAELARYDLKKEKVDVAIVPFWLLLESSGVAMIRDNVGARRVFPMHVPLEGSASVLFGSALNRKGVVDLLQSIPGVILLDKPLDERVVPRTDG